MGAGGIGPPRRQGRIARAAKAVTPGGERLWGVGAPPRALAGSWGPHSGPGGVRVGALLLLGVWGWCLGSAWSLSTGIRQTRGERRRAGETPHLLGRKLGSFGDFEGLGSLSWEEAGGRVLVCACELMGNQTEVILGSQNREWHTELDVGGDSHVSRV